MIYILHLGSVSTEAQSVNNLQSGLSQRIWFPVAALRAAADLCRLQASATLLQHEGHYTADCRSSSITRHADGTSIHNIGGKDHTLTVPCRRCGRLWGLFSQVSNGENLSKYRSFCASLGSWPAQVPCQYTGVKPQPNTGHTFVSLMWRGKLNLLFHLFSVSLKI